MQFVQRENRFVTGAGYRNSRESERKIMKSVRMSELGNLKILAKTVKSVFNHEGISSDTSVTMEEFMGSKD